MGAILKPQFTGSRWRIPTFKKHILLSTVISDPFDARDGNRVTQRHVERRVALTVRRIQVLFRRPQPDPSLRRRAVLWPFCVNLPTSCDYRHWLTSALFTPT